MLRNTAHQPLVLQLIYLRDLLKELVVREMKLRYKRSLLGIVWTLLNPLAQLLVFNFVFRYVLPLQIPNYAAFLFTGLLAWNWFQASMLTGTGGIVDNRELVKRPGFPPVILPIVSVTTNLIHFLLALPVLLLFLLLNGFRLNGAILFLPALLAVQFLLTVGLVYLFAAVHVTLRDTQYLLGIALMLGFYLTPVLYDLGSVPERFHWAYWLNPLAAIISSYRSILLNGELPGNLSMLYLVVISLLALWAGYRLFVKVSDRFIEEL